MPVHSSETGKAMVTVLERLGHQVEYPAGQSCCGQMHFNTGCRREAVPMARRFARAFDGYDAIVTPSASCAAMVREYQSRSAPGGPGPGEAPREHRASNELRGSTRSIGPNEPCGPPGHLY